MATLTILPPLSYQELQRRFQQIQAELASLKKVKDAAFRGKFSEWVFKSLHEGGEITIQTLTGKKIKIHVSTRTTVLNVKHSLMKQEGVPVQNSRLIFGGQQMMNHRTLFHYRVPVGATVHLVVNLDPRLVISNKRQEEKDCHDDDYWINYYWKKLLNQRLFELKYP